MFDKDIVVIKPDSPSLKTGYNTELLVRRKDVYHKHKTTLQSPEYSDGNNSPNPSPRANDRMES